MSINTINIEQGITLLKQQFQDAGNDRPGLAAELLMAELVGVSRLELFSTACLTLTKEQQEILEQWIPRIFQHEPVQYLIGSTSFRGLTIKTDKRALIPRPETEQLVELIIASGAFQQSSKISAVDVGTGTGCIAISLALAFPESSWLAIDISPEALSLAQENTKQLGVNNIVFQQGNLLSGSEKNSADMVIANLPYIAFDVCQHLSMEVRNHEPLQALDGGEDGLLLVRRLLKQAKDVIRPQGWVYLEIGDDQGKLVCELCQKNGFKDIVLKKDLAGYDRFVVAQQSSVT